MKDYCVIRKGTQPLTAMKKIARITRDYVLSNSTNLKVKETILVEFRIKKV